MISKNVCLFFALLALFLGTSCVADNTENLQEKMPKLIFETNPEMVKGKQNVYDSIARGVKYNVDLLATNLQKKIYNEKNDDPQILIQKILKNKVNDENKLIQAERLLDFSIIYAIANISDDPVFRGGYLYEIAAQHLTITAIKNHQNAWFALKNDRNLKRLQSSELKVVSNLKEKEQKNGTLSDRENDYLKNQALQLTKLSEMQNALAANVAEYAAFTKMEPKEVDLEGRKFYELENFDEDYSLRIFQEAAMRNRKEFALAKEYKQTQYYSELRREISNKYSPVARLDINGIKIENDVYEQELYEKAVNVAESLLNKINGYMQASKTNKQKYEKELFVDLGVALLTQTEINYQLVMLYDVEYEKAVWAEKDLRQEIKRLERIRVPNADEKVALLSAKLAMFMINQKKTEITANRAAYLRNLYFCAGLNPYNVTMLKDNLSQIAKEVKSAFSKDLVVMLSDVDEKSEIMNNQLSEKGWAQKDNWLEEVVESKNVNNKKQQNDENYSYLQLGAYREKINADKDWNKISALITDINKFNHRIITAEVYGLKWYRLVLDGDIKQLRQVCEKIKMKGYDCLLR